MIESESILSELKQDIMNTIDFNSSFDDEVILDLIRKKVFDKGKDIYLQADQRTELIEKVYNYLKKFDILQPLIDDPEVSEIMVNGVNDVFTEKNGIVKRININFTEKERLEQIIQRIVSRVNRTVNEANPIVDARLEDGSRVNIVMDPIALNGPILTIRKFRKDKITIEDLIKNGTLTQDAADFLKKVVKARYNIFISGGTSSGKTTFLNILTNFIPREERIITIEDSAELQIKGIDNIVRLETRNKNVEGKGEITIKDLIKTSLRMRPDRIIVGEVRGEEALDMLQAMNTGHDGSLSTGHANSTSDAFSRLETMVLTGVDMPLVAIKHQIASALDIIIHLAKTQNGQRKVMEISEVVDYTDGEINLNCLYEYSISKKDKGQLNKVNELINNRKLKMYGNQE